MGAFYHDAGIYAVNELLSSFLLLSVPGLPLLLAFPALHSHLSWLCHIALLPAVILLAVPAVVSIEVPWLLLGTGLGISGASQLLLAMSVVLWAAATTLLHAPTNQPADKRFTTFLLLTMAGNLGAILATDLVGFFAFSTLMGYGFYGLLVDDGSEAARRTGRIYLGFMIVADLALFEALLIAAATTEDTGFEAVRHAMAQSGSSGLYLSMVLVGFAAKAGIWPLHYWLPLAFRSTRPAVALLLGGVPVAIGLLGAARWLPLGEITSSDLGLIIQGLGVAAMLYAILAGVKRAQLKLLPAYVAIVATGLFTTAIGTELSDPAVWNEYDNLAHFFIVALGIGLAVLVIAIRWLQARYHCPAAPAAQADDLSIWFEHWPGAVVRWVGQMGFDTLPTLHTSWMDKVGHLRQESELLNKHVSELAGLLNS
jgi:formate hydrogenlyase subunit 3/multisubunit Na+/H+ antiporter MnhD subunit